jgi:signal transduction histidine kinase
MLEMSDAKSMTVIERNDSISAVEIASEAVEDSDIVNAKHLMFTMQVEHDVENVVLTTNEQAAVRALTLLLDNARKFTAPAETHESGVTAVADEKQRVTLRLKVVDDAVCFEVEDSGIGVPEEEAEHIFEEFVQLDEYYNGTGIGLTVARSLARRLGGDVVLDTSYTDGARFILMLQKA